MQTPSQPSSQSLHDVERKYAWFEEMRATRPVWLDDSSECWHVFRYEDVNHVLADHSHFSSISAGVFALALLLSPPIFSGWIRRSTASIARSSLRHLHPGRSHVSSRASQRSLRICWIACVRRGGWR